MAVISFSDEDIWLTARWAFKRLFSDINDRFSLEPDVQYTFKKAVALDGLHFDMLEKNRNEILYMIKVTITELIYDETESHRKNLDEKGYSMYREALPELLGYIERFERKSDVENQTKRNSSCPVEKNI